jgi:hypothetical protein
MTPELIYWVVVAAIGAGAALVSLVVGMKYYGYLRNSRPELLKGYWPEMVRDVLLVVGLSLNLLVGIAAIMAKSPATTMITLFAILGGATCVSLFAIFNLVLRIGR